jgi:hypothetical protein
VPKLRHGVPAGWQWRDGRPRWIPSPTLRKAGWKGQDLKDGRGLWLARGASIEAAQAIADAAQAWRGGDVVPSALAAAAPAGATTAPRAVAADPFSLGALIDAYTSSDELKFKKNGEPRPKATIDDYRRKLKRLVDALSGHAKLPEDTTDPVYVADVARVRQMSVFVLEPVEGPSGMIDPLRLAYWALRDQAGLHMAFGVLACASAWLAWCRRIKSRKIVNWAEEVDRETPPGRIKIVTFQEIAALVAAGDALGLPEISDAVILSLDLSWSQADVLNLDWSRVVCDAKGRWRADTGTDGRQKTGRVGGTPFLQLGLRRLQKIRDRQADMTVRPLKVIHLQRTRQHSTRTREADSDYFRKQFAVVRAQAALAVPSCSAVTFADLRDTAFTLGRQAGFTDDMTASRTLQSRANIKTLADRNYGEVGPTIADAAADLLDPYMEAELLKAGVKL